MVLQSNSSRAMLRRCWIQLIELIEWIRLIEWIELIELIEWIEWMIQQKMTGAQRPPSPTGRTHTHTQRRQCNAFWFCVISILFFSLLVLKEDQRDLEKGSKSRSGGLEHAESLGRFDAANTRHSKTKKRKMRC